MYRFQFQLAIAVDDLPANTALLHILSPNYDFSTLMKKFDSNSDFLTCMSHLEELAMLLKPPPGQQSLSRPMQRKLVNLIQCQLLESEGRTRAMRAARSLGERSVVELLLKHQNPSQVTSNLWSTVRSRGCQFLGPFLQEQILKVILSTMKSGAEVSRKDLINTITSKLDANLFRQTSKTNIGHVIQLLYKASCFSVTRRQGQSSLMKLKEEVRDYVSLRREHDAQIIQMAAEVGLRIGPEQWSNLLYGNIEHKAQMQSIMDKLQTSESFLQSVQELVVLLQRTGDPKDLGKFRPELDILIKINPSSGIFSFQSVYLVRTITKKFIGKHFF